MTPLVRTTARIDPAAAVFGAPLPDGVWDAHVAARWEGIARGTPLRHGGPPLPAPASGRAVAYSNRRRELTLDLKGRLQGVATDARPTEGRIGGRGDGRIVLPEVHFAETTAPPTAEPPRAPSDETAQRGCAGPIRVCSRCASSFVAR